MFFTSGITDLTLDDRFTLMGNVSRPARGSGFRGRARGRAGVTRQSTIRSMDLMAQMESRPSVRAALRLRRIPLKPAIKQRLTLKRGVNNNRRNFRRSNSIGSVYTVPLKSEPQNNFRTLRRSSSMNSLNSFASTNGRSRSMNRSTSRSRSRSRSQNRNLPQNRFPTRSRSQIRSQPSVRSRPRQRNPRGQITKVFRRNSIASVSDVVRQELPGFGRGRPFNRSRGGARRTNFGAPGRIIRNRRISNAQINGQSQGQSTRRRGTTAGRARGGNRGRGRGGNKSGAVTIKKEQLDAELDTYMLGSKSQLDQELEKYMSNTSMDFN